jgi:hypothetical protein
MRPLTADDILPLEDFASRRRQLFQSFRRYLERCRRVHIGPEATLIFENRRTLWFRVQDLLRIARLSDTVRIQEELDIYNRLLPGRDQLQAALLLGNSAGDTETEQNAKKWQSLRGDNLKLFLGGKSLSAQLITCRPEDRAMGTAHWVQFTITGQNRRDFANSRIPARFAISLPDYQHESRILSEEMRQSLVDDLKLSDADELKESA